MLDLDETIVAIASARGGSLRGILRLSGPQAWQVVGCSFLPVLPQPSHDCRPRAITGCLSLPALNSSVPATLFLSRAPRSYTGEDLVEVHMVGSTPILEQALSTFVAAGARQALPGEFTMRAFLNRKLDLTAAEAIHSLIDATNSHQADVALRQIAGGIARPIQNLRDQLLDLLADLEAGLDFADEDIEFIDRSQLRAVLEHAAQQLADLSRQMRTRSLSMDRGRVILAGRPNVGKSSLFNALLCRTSALVSHAAGTTRDYLTAPLLLSDCTVELVDTAGIEQARDAIDRLGQLARERAAESADLIVWCDDDSVVNPIPLSSVMNSDAAVIVARTKCDLSWPSASDRHCDPSSSQCDHRQRGEIAVSAFTGAGLDQLRRAIEDWIHGQGSGEAGVVVSTATRCHQAIDAAAQAIQRARTQLDAGSSDELTALELRLVLDELGRVVGAVYTDDILDRIFSRFCIGK